jgi:hypothetical protein
MENGPFTDCLVLNMVIFRNRKITSLELRGTPGSTLEQGPSQTSPLGPKAFHSAVGGGLRVFEPDQLVVLSPRPTHDGGQVKLTTWIYHRENCVLAPGSQLFK